MILTSIPQKNEFPYYFEQESQKHCWYPSWDFLGKPIRVTKLGSSAYFEVKEEWGWNAGAFHPYTQVADESLPAPENGFSMTQRLE